MEIIYQPHINRELESLIERIYPPRISVDNESYRDCTVVKVDSANKHGILLEMVQVLTDLDLVISKSCISSDGGWFMDDKLGNKVTDENLILYIEQALCATRLSEISNEVQLQRCVGRAVRPRHVFSTTEYTALEMSGMDRPGLVSEISAALVDLGCNITAAVSWTHNNRLACIIYIEDAFKPGPILDPSRLVQLQEQLATVVEVHDGPGERNTLRLTTPASGRTHTERRLHQLLYAAKDYERFRACSGEIGGRHKKGCDGTHVSIERCMQKGYWVVNVKSRDRQKLLFDTVCVLTDMQYNVFHAAVSSRGSMAYQEYYVRHRNGPDLDKESERQKLILCLIAALERRFSHGLRLDLCTKNRMGLLSDITRVFRENGLSLSTIEVGTHREKALGSFYVTDSSGQDMRPDLVELVRKETGGCIIAVPESPNWGNQASSSIRARQGTNTEGDGPRSSIGSFLWSHLGRLSSNFGLIGS